MGVTQPRRIEERFVREIWLALVLLMLALAQSAMLPRILGAAPNLLLLLIVCRALLSGPASAARWAFYAGLGLDFCADTMMGMHALAFLAAVLLGTVPLMRFNRGNWLLPLISVVLGSVAYHCVLGLLTWAAVAPINLRLYLPIVFLPATAVVLIPALPLFLIMRWIEGRRRGEVPIDVY